MKMVSGFDLFFVSSTVQLINGASHHVHADQPDEFNRVVEGICNTVK